MQAVVKVWLRENKFSLVALVEARVRQGKAKKIQKKINPRWDWLDNYASHLLGKIWIAWDPMVFDVQLIKEATQVMFLKVRHTATGVVVLISAIYAANTVQERRKLWRNLKDQAIVIDCPWIAIGDWNISRFHSEKMGGLRVPQYLLDEFNQVIKEIQIEELPINNGGWSWSNKQGRDRRITIKLDRVLANEVWLHKFTDTAFDSCLSVRPLWDEVEELVFQVWNESVGGNPLHKLQKKLRAVKAIIRDWNKKKSKLSEQVQVMTEDLHKVQMELLQDPMNPGLISKEREATLKLQSTLDLEEILWCQKSRVKWLKEGDKCSAYFHNMVKQRRCYNAITCLKHSGGVTSSDPQVIKDWLVQYYEELYAAKDSVVTEELDREVTAEEIKRVVLAFSPDKAPVPDGFPARYFQKYWHIVGNDLTSAVIHYFTTAVMPMGINSTFLALIPKPNHGDKLENYRPIALGNLSYKIITKILANRLSVVFPKIVGLEQFAFIKGRRIHDNILLVTDVIKNFGLKTTGPAMALKVDLRKAYDSVSWEFIHKTLQVYGFSAQWIKWIMQCVTSSKFSVLCNGVPTGYFSAGRGIRQGCPLSPLLFTLITDHFSTLMHEKIVGGQIKLCNVVQKTGLLVSHAFYADDLFIIVKADLSTAKTVDEVLKRFHGVSGLEVNKDKSSVIFSKAVRGKRRILQLLQMKNEVFPLKYLGITLEDLSLSDQSYIRSCIIGFLDLKFHGAVLLLWRKSSNTFCGVGNWSQVKWSQVTLPYAEGGFNLRRISDIDFAAKVSICWDFLRNKETLWVQWMHAKYLQQYNFWMVTPKAQDSSIWKQILETRDFIQENVVFKIGNGGSFNMLFDPWCVGLSLTQRFGATMFKNFDKQAKLETLIVDGGWVFPPFFPEIAAEFVANVPLKAGNDEISWTHGEFSLKNAWAACRTRGQVVRGKSLCWKYYRPRVAAEDTNNHLFCTCEYAVEVWQQVVIWLNITDIRFQELSVFVEWMLQLTQVKGFKSKLLKGLFVVFVWKIWMERNAALHSGSKVSSAAAANDIIWEVLNFFSLGLADMLAIFDVG
ncbi:uncharacterized protein LOC132269780 [Cornus florida]|uniref:uncharacterized protein LOC132269780 n=1 Tax=Cornus florida TaxID=4283 RepID=UPI002897B568|nr:uncharacterized protein LOC132269780 [Cornus florida]